MIDDEVTTRDALTELLGKDGREIITASDRQEALERLTELPRPRLILLDMMIATNGWSGFSSASVDRPVHCPHSYHRFVRFAFTGRSATPAEHTC
jgi:DNA-binding response OmpR family regulator